MAPFTSPHNAREHRASTVRHPDGSLECSASLVAIAGPLAGQVFPFEDVALSIGCGSSNKLAIPDLGLSRLHCIIEIEQGRPVVRDLESLNGTFVNDVPVKVRGLQHGDQIRVGDSILLVLCQEAASDGRPPVEMR